MDFRPDVVLIVGAGFSKNAGLPLANQFTEWLLDTTELSPAGPSVAQVEFLKEFVSATFNGGLDTPHTDWPELEDIFTLIDLSANTGHHLGRDYSAANLRVVRRAMIVRIVRMLEQTYKSQLSRRATPTSAALNTLFDDLQLENTSVLSMNWDLVIERGVAKRQSVEHVDYGNRARAVRFENDDVKTRPRPRPEYEVLHLLKPHGSINWLYCDACRELFWVRPAQTEGVARTLFQQRDWYAVLGQPPTMAPPKSIQPNCPHCRSQSLGTRIATFSFRKALDFPMHAATWSTAEAHLKRASHWVFFGYSMPAADFEFKYLLKRVQLTERTTPEITVITGGDPPAAQDTINRYKKFFGEVPGERHYFREGLTTEVIDHLRDIGALREKPPATTTPSRSRTTGRRGL